MKLTAQEINDVLDLAECCVHDKMHNPNERDWVQTGLKAIRTSALSAEKLSDHLDEIYELIGYTKARGEQTGESPMDLINDLKSAAIKAAAEG